MWVAPFLGSLHMESELTRQPCVGLETLPHKVGPNKDIKDLSEEDCDAPI